MQKMDFYSVIKRDAILIHATTELNLETIMPHEKKTDQKGHTYCQIPHIRIIHNRKIHGNKRQLVVAKGWGMENNK